MQKLSYSQKMFSSKRKANSLKTMENGKKSSKVSIKLTNDNKKIPRIINQIQQNLILLKKYYEQEQLQLHNQHNEFRRRPSRSNSSNIKNKQKHSEEHMIQQQTTATVPQIDDLKKSFISMNGYDTNNIVQLYNFYKKNMEKSTRLFGSTSMSNVVNITNNHSQIREKGVKPNSGYVISQDQHTKQNETKQYGLMIAPLCHESNKIKNNNLNKKNNDMISVANLLADKKKVSRVDICENMNTENLISQAKRRLYRPNPSENIQKFNRLKQNQKNQNIRISSGKKIKKQNQNDMNQHLNKTNEIKQKSNKKPSQNIVLETKTNQFQINADEPSKLIYSNKNNDQIDNFRNKIQTNAVQAIVLDGIALNSAKRGENIISNENECKDVKELKSAKSQKSVKSIKSIRSPHSFRSPSLNRGIILDITGSCGKSSQKNSAQAYFVPRVHVNTHDSLLDCEITPKDQSKMLDLESIPFDF